MGIDLKHLAFDVVLAAYVVNPSYITSDIKSIIERFMPTKLPYFEEIYGKKPLMLFQMKPLWLITFG